MLRRLRVSGTGDYAEVPGSEARGISLTYRAKSILHTMTSARSYGIVWARVEKSDFLRETRREQGGMAMESTALTIKFVMMYAFEVFVVAVMGAVVIAGLYQLVRDHVRERRVPAPAVARKSQ
jgi:hypothetical protein